MLDINEIAQYYPQNLRVYKRFILREYLQYKILEIVFNGPFANKLVFLGGTCLRLLHGNQRFSEDLDFDNFDLTRIVYEGFVVKGYRPIEMGACEDFLPQA